MAAPGKTRRRIEKARKVSETIRKAAALGAQEQAADMVDTKTEDGDETEGEGSATRGGGRGGERWAKNRQVRARGQSRKIIY